MPESQPAPSMSIFPSESAETQRAPEKSMTLKPSVGQTHGGDHMAVGNAKIQVPGGTSSWLEEPSGARP